MRARRQPASRDPRPGSPTEAGGAQGRGGRRAAPARRWRRRVVLPVCAGVALSVTAAGLLATEPGATMLASGHSEVVESSSSSTQADRVPRWMRRHGSGEQGGWWNRLQSARERWHSQHGEDDRRGFEQRVQRAQVPDDEESSPSASSSSAPTSSASPSSSGAGSGATGSTSSPSSSSPSAGRGAGSTGSGSTGAGAGSAGATGTVFPGASWLNAPIPSSPRIDSGSPAMVKDLAAGKQSAAIHSYGVPIFRTTGSKAVTVDLTEDWGTNVFASARVALTSAMQPSRGTDGAMVVLDESGGFSNEFWQYSWNGGSPSASWGARLPLSGDGRDKNAPTGAGISRLAGVVTQAEFSAGVIPHALVFSSDNSCSGTLRFPATKTDGDGGGSGCLPEGARVQLDPGVDISGLPAKERMVAQALQTYGAYNIDNGGASMAFIFESPTGGSDAYASAGWKDYHELELPWEKLRVLSSWDGR